VSHTPGPWELESDEQTGRAIYVTVRTGELDHAIATVDTPANARLIAAAPDLLEALQREQEWQDRDRDGALDPEWSYEDMVAAPRRAALAKAGV
jgi:hypothetical protein